MTPRVSKHRLFVWAPAGTLPDSATIAIARDDNYSFGVLHSRTHEVWARAMGTQLLERESGFRYTPTTTFETFPWPLAQVPKEERRVKAIAEAACRLNGLREAWLNPPGIVEADFKQRTLTNLYNSRPTWLAQAHESLDRAVLDAYGWPQDIDDETLLANLLALNLAREPAGAGGARDNNTTPA